jgi:hypothetical protein
MGQTVLSYLYIVSQCILSCTYNLLYIILLTAGFLGDKGTLDAISIAVYIRDLGDPRIIPPTEQIH